MKTPRMISTTGLDEKYVYKKAQHYLQVIKVLWRYMPQQEVFEYLNQTWRKNGFKWWEMALSFITAYKTKLTSGIIGQQGSPAGILPESWLSRKFNTDKRGKLPAIWQHITQKVMCHSFLLQPQKLKALQNKQGREYYETCGNTRLSIFFCMLVSLAVCLFIVYMSIIITETSQDLRITERPSVLNLAIGKRGKWVRSYRTVVEGQSIVRCL